MPHNIQLFRILNGLVFEAPLWDKLFVFGAQHLIFVVAAIGLTVFVLSENYTGKQLCFVISAALLGWLAAKAMKLVVGAPRPFVSLENLNLLVKNPPGSFSFPSGHATFMFAGAFSVWVFSKKWSIFFLICALVVGISRVIVGLHWPLDILGGMVLAALVVGATFKVANSISPKLFKVKN